MSEYFMTKDGEQLMLFPQEKDDMVNHPKHYQIGEIETLDIIECMLTPEEYRGFLKGSILKYRERAMFKGNPERDWGKAKFYYDVLETKKGKKRTKKGKKGTKK